VTGILECGSTTGGVSPSSNSLRAWLAADSRPLLRRWGYTAALVVGLLAVFVSPSGRDIEDLVQLERLVPKIERAQTLSPEARETIERLVARQSLAVGSNDQTHQMRRKAAIERVTSAMKAKEESFAGGALAAR
jgi:predicted HAD superfamily phosphohydrolase